MNSGFIVAISVLTAIFFGALVILVLVVRKKLCKSFDVFSEYYQPENVLEQNLVENIETCENNSGVELDEVAATNEFYEDEVWTKSVVDLMPHCLGILKTAHLLTDKIVKITLIEPKELHLPETLSDLVQLAKKIGFRVDDVVRSMYPPLDPRLLEARCSALAFSVNHLVLLAKSVRLLSESLDWVDQALADVEDHLKVLREVSTAYETNMANRGCSLTLESIKEDRECEEHLGKTNGWMDSWSPSCLVTSSSL